MSEVLRITGLSYRYDHDLILKDISFVVRKGEFVGIVGPNGSGKSTLLKCILNLLEPETGQVICAEQKIGFVSQKASAYNTGFPATVAEVVASGLVRERIQRAVVKARTLEALREVSMEDYLHQNIGALSGGQQQRVFIARALISEPELLVLDEPTVGIDEANVVAFYSLLKHLNKKHQLTILMVTHDIDTICDTAERIISINKRLVFDGSAKEFGKLRSKELHDIYGCALEELV